MGCKLISLDTSSSSTGVGIYIDGKLDRYFSINKQHLLKSEERLCAMIQDIYDTIKREKPDIVVTEMTVVTRNAQAQRYLTMILGAIYGLCVDCNIFYYSFRPSEWRSLINKEKKPRKREELKQWSIETVSLLFGIQSINDDIADAILIGQAYINKFV